MSRPNFWGKNLKRLGRPSSKGSDGAADSESQTDDGTVGLREVWCFCTILADRRASRDAILLGISETHARIRFRDRALLPKTLRIKAPRMGLNRSARVTWQTTFDAGLKFDEED